MRLRIELYCTDLTAAERFWTGILGFHIAEDGRTNPVPYLGLVRDEAHVGMAVAWEELRNDRHTPPHRPELLLDVDDLQAERDRIVETGWPLLEDITVRPWGVRDIRLADPAGYPIRLCEALPGEEEEANDGGDGTTPPSGTAG